MRSDVDQTQISFDPIAKDSLKKSNKKKNGKKYSIYHSNHLKYYEYYKWLKWFDPSVFRVPWKRVFFFFCTESTVSRGHSSKSNWFGSEWGPRRRIHCEYTKRSNNGSNDCLLATLKWTRLITIRLLAIRCAGDYERSAIKVVAPFNYKLRWRQVTKGSLSVTAQQPTQRCLIRVDCNSTKEKSCCIRE